MKKITSIFSLLLLIAATAMAQTVVISVGPSDGTYADGGNYVSQITFASTPVLTITASANNMDKRVTDVLQWHSGTAGSCTYTISVADGYLITEYSITGYGNNAVQTLTAGTVSHEFAVGTPSTFTVTGLGSASTSFVQTGVNSSGIKITAISVTVKKPTEEQAAAHAKASGWLELMQNTLALVTNASDYISNAIQSGEGSYAALLDKNNTTYFHSAWSGTMSSVGGHDLQARLPEAVNSFYLFYVTRSNGTGYPQAMRIDGSNNAADFTDAAAGGATWTNSVSSLSGLPSGATKSYLSDKISLSEAYQYLRFVPDVSYKSTNWFCLAEFWLLRSNEATDAAIEMLKNLPSAIDLTAEQIEQINQIDEDLRNTMAEVTYVVKDTNGNTLFTSEPQQVVKGTTITTLPADFQRAPFYTYNTVSETVNTSTTVEFTATLKPESEWPVKYTEDATNPYYYNLTIRNKYIIRQSDNTVKNQTESSPFNPAASWAFIGTPYGGFRVINQEAGENLNLMYDQIRIGRHSVNCVTMRENDTRTWILDTNNDGFVLSATENPTVYLHQRNDDGLSTCDVTEWGPVHDDEGSTILASTDKDVLVQLYNQMNGKNDLVGEGLGKYSVSGMTADEFQALLDDVKSDLDNDVTSDFLSDYNALNAVTFSINQPETGFYRIKGYSGNYITLNTAGSNASMSGEANINNIVCYTPDNQLVFYANGFGMYNTSIVAPLGETLNTYTFLEGAQAGHYYIKSNASGVGTYCYDNTADGSKVDRNGSPVTSGDYQTDWTLEEVTELPITLKAYEGQYYATFSAPVDIAEISDATIYKLEIQSEKYAKYVDAEATSVPANVGVLLIGPSATATATIGESTSGLTVTDTNLHPQLPCEKGAGSATKLYLGKSGGKLGFYKMQEWTEEKPYVTNGFKAYFVPTEPVSGAKEGFELVGDEVTGIETIDNGLTIDNGAVYNLQGQKVNKAQKGVFIQNGKKVVVK